MEQGIYAIQWPDAENALNLLVSPTRGLFFWTPFLLLAFIGYPQLARETRSLFWLAYIIPLLQIIVISGRTWDWQAGPTLGPRYLAPILPVLSLPCAFAAQRQIGLSVLLATYSIVITTAATLTNAMPEAEIYNPLLDVHLQDFLRGEFSPNLGIVLSLCPFQSAVLFYLGLIAGIGWVCKELQRQSNELGVSNSS
jgi:hypothetical protein